MASSVNRVDRDLRQRSLETDSVTRKALICYLHLQGTRSRFRSAYTLTPPRSWSTATLLGTCNNAITSGPCLFVVYVRLQTFQQVPTTIPATTSVDVYLAAKEAKPFASDRVRLTCRLESEPRVLHGRHKLQPRSESGDHVFECRDASGTTGLLYHSFICCCSSLGPVMVRGFATEPGEKGDSSASSWQKRKWSNPSVR